MKTMGDGVEIDDIAPFSITNNLHNKTQIPSSA